MPLDYPDLEVTLKALSVGDFETEYMIVERKELNDFISSFTTKKERKDGTTYERLDSQLERLKEHPAPVKVLLIHGDMEDIHSRIHPHSVIGFIASLTVKYPWLCVLPLVSGLDWSYLVYRLGVKAEKYYKERD
jgi:ERCC4-type nuclease